MRKIIYYVATSLDGYISGPGGDISGFVQQGEGVDQYMKDLQDFDTVIMGRKTYEFGYKYGLEPGQLAYPHMKHYIFSSNLTLEDHDEGLTVSKMDIEKIDELKKEEGGDIYLCGGGDFAGWLLDHEKIDILKIKLNPLVLGEGVKLFGSSKKSPNLEVTESAQYSDGLHIITYRVSY